MNLFRKTLALLLAAAMAATALSGCNASQSSTASSGTKGNGIATINGEDVSLEEYRYYFLNTKASMDAQFGGLTGETSSNSSSQDMWANADMLSALKESSMNALTQDYVIRQLAKENGIELTDEDKAKVTKTIEENKTSMGGQEAYLKWLSDTFLTEELYRKMMDGAELSAKLQDYIAKGEGNFEVKDEDIKKDVKEKYLHASHILIQTQGITDEAELAKKKETAEKALARAKAGEDFSALIKEYGEDPGMEQSPEGYYFAEGEMVPEFYEGAKALADNEISPLVQSSYGWHIIKRLPLTDDYFTQNKDSLRSKYAFEKANTKLDEMMAAVKLETTEAYDAIDATLA